MTKYVNALHTQRQTLGCLGILLPFLCLLFGSLGGAENYYLWYGSMSATYYTPAGNAFIGVLWATGIFLISYSIAVLKEYGIKDFIINLASGIFAIMIAVFPNASSELTHVGLFHLPIAISDIFHSGAAVAFFILLSVNILWLFRKGSNEPTQRKKLRNLVYLICGIGIIISIIICGLGMIFNWHDMIVWIMEAFMLVFFGTAWLTKGAAIKIFNDKEN